MAMVDLTRLYPAVVVVSSALACAVFGAFAWPQPAHAETTIHFTLNRRIDGPAAPFFLAIDRGYFKAEGLDVTIDAATGGSPDVIDRLAAGNADMGVADINALIKYRDNASAPVKAVFMVFDRPAYAIIARRSRGVASPRDLAGKMLGAPSADPAAAQWPVFAGLNGIDTGKVTVENIGLPVREPMLAAGEVDAITGCTFTSYIDLKERGVPSGDLVVLPMADYGVELYGDAIMVAPAFAADRPEAVRAFLRAYLKALKDTVRDPVRAIDAVVSRSEGARPEIELARLRLAIHDNIVTAAVKANGYGDMDPQRFATAIDQLEIGYRFRAKDKAAEAFDPSFLPPAAERRAIDTALR